MLKYFHFSLIFTIFPIIRAQNFLMNMNPAVCCFPQQFHINQENYGCEWRFNSFPGIIKYAEGMEMTIILPNREEIGRQCSCLTCQLKRIKPNHLRILFDLEYQHELAANISKFLDEFIETCSPPPHYSNDFNLFTSLREMQYKYYLDFYDLQWTGWKYLAISFFIAFCISTIVAIALAFIICCKIRRSN